MKNIGLLFLLNTQILFCIGGHSSTQKFKANNIEQEYLKKLFELEREERQDANKLLNNHNVATIVFFQKFKIDNEDDEVIKLYTQYLKRNGCNGIQNWLKKIPKKCTPISEGPRQSISFLQPSL